MTQMVIARGAQISNPVMKNLFIMDDQLEAVVLVGTVACVPESFCALFCAVSGDLADSVVPFSWVDGLAVVLSLLLKSVTYQPDPFN